MLLGDTCTRFCKFCNVKTGNPQGKVDADEPENLADAVEQMELTYVVLTMVDRDDLPDGGAAHVAKCIQALKARVPDLKVEMLAGDFQDEENAINTIVHSSADVFAHNIEVVERLSPAVRDKKCGYEQTMNVLKRAKRLNPDIVTKSSIMVGLGETEEEVIATLKDLRAADVDIVTVGQYLRPAPKFLPVEEYVTPEKFIHYKEVAAELGFLFCASGPLVRSSYRAGELFLENYLRTGGASQV
ncbi:MAG: lipoic acid synthetase [Planctomycetota bacterium]|jgi:lipoic acid synthetase